MSVSEDAAGQDSVRVGTKRASEQSDHARASKKQLPAEEGNLIPGVPNSALVSASKLMRGGVLHCSKYTHYHFTLIQPPEAMVMYARYQLAEMAQAKGLSEQVTQTVLSGQKAHSIPLLAPQVGQQ